MANPKCLITGCRLVLPAENKEVWGDLHLTGHAMVFNAVLGGRGEAAWRSIDPRLEAHEKQVSLGYDVTYFERRGVICWDAIDTDFNDLAADYVKKWLDAPDSRG